MQKFLFEVQEIKSMYLEIEADSSKEAYLKLDENYFNGDYKDKKKEDKLQYIILNPEK